jgi:single-strand DNA-binding protein
VAFGKLAEIMDKFLGKGSKIFVDGEFRTRQWEDKDGNTRYTTEIVANNMLMLSDAPGGPPRKETKQPRQQDTASTPGFDEDLPF